MKMGKNIRYIKKNGEKGYLNLKKLSKLISNSAESIYFPIDEETCDELAKRIYDKCDRDRCLEREEYVGQVTTNLFGNNVVFTLMDVTKEFEGAKIRDIEDSEGRHIFGIVRHENLITALPSIKLEKGDKLVIAEKKVTIASEEE